MINYIRNERYAYYYLNTIQPNICIILYILLYMYDR